MSGSVDDASVGGATWTDEVGSVGERSIGGASSVDVAAVVVTAGVVVATGSVEVETSSVVVAIGDGATCVEVATAVVVATGSVVVPMAGEAEAEMSPDVEATDGTAEADAPSAAV